MHFRVIYNVKDVVAFVFNVRDQQEAVGQVAESAMREVIGRRQLEPIVTHRARARRRRRRSS
jgi:membrane protease subunit HflK